MKQAYSRTLIAVALLVLMFFVMPCMIHAETKNAGQTQKRPQEPAAGSVGKEEKKLPWDQKPSVTHHSIMINGRLLKYTATAGYMPLTDGSGKPTAYVFFTSYVREHGPEKTGRPLTFAFNGGPGAASVWLHIGALGPKRALLSDDGKGLPAPYEWVTNEETWLDFTDLVFIDPVGTGYSRPAEGVKGEEFHGIQRDVESIAQFIRLYCARNERWLSPKFLAGESYGTTRAAALSKYLQDKVGMALNGLALISSILNFQTIAPGPDNDLAYALFLPSYTLTAMYHKRLSPGLGADPDRTRKEIERFALSDYLVALAKGYTISTSEKEAIVEKLAAYTGLKPQFIRNSNLRIDRRSFSRLLFEEGNLRPGLYDSRYTGRYRAETFMEDPSMFDVTAPMLSAFNDYLRRELRYESDIPYEFLSEKTFNEWNWGSAAGGYVNVTTSLAMALNQNRFLKVFVASGYYDLVTPYFATKYTFDRMGPDTDLRSRVTLEYYNGGHQLYMDRVSRRKLKSDGAAFFLKAVRGEAHSTAAH